LQFESSHVLIVSQNLDGLVQNHGVEVDVEGSNFVRMFLLQDHSQSLHGFKTQLHQFRLLVLHSEDDGVDQSLEAVTLEVEEAFSAVLDNALHE
jgi:hypothetical protein